MAKQPTKVACPSCGMPMRVVCVTYGSGNMGWLYWCDAQRSEARKESTPVVLTTIPHGPLP